MRDLAVPRGAFGAAASDGGRAARSGLCGRFAAFAVAFTLLASAVLTAPPPSAAEAAQPASVTKGLDYLHACQRSDGGFGEKGSASSEQLTAWAIVAIGAAGEDPGAWKVNGHSPVAYLARNSSRWHSTTDYARTVLAVVAAKGDPRHFGGVDLVAKITADRHDDGSAGDRFGPYVNSHIWAMLALRGAGVAVSEREVRWLRGQQNSDGGWGWAPGMTSDSNDTAAAIQALIAAGQAAGSDSVSSAVAYLSAKQLSTGAFSYSGPTGDANSTSWAIQALVAAGQSPSSKAWRKGKSDPLSYLRGLQRSDGGFKYSASQVANPLLVAVEAIPALARKPFPVKAPAHPARPAAAAPRVRAVWPAPGKTATWRSGSAIRFDVSDPGGTGVSTAGIRAKLDGKTRSVRLAKGVASLDAGALSAGWHTLSVLASDRAGNTSSIPDWRFAVTYESAAAASAATLPTSAASPTTSSPLGGAPFGQSATGTAGWPGSTDSTMTSGTAVGSGDASAAAGASMTAVGLDAASAGGGSSSGGPASLLGAGLPRESLVVLLVAGGLVILILVAGAIAWRRA